MFARFCTIVLFGVSLNAQSPARFYSAEKEAALGAHLADEISKQMPAVRDSMVQGYLESIAHALGAQINAGQLNWHLSVIRDNVGGSTHEPLSIPGGHVFIPASLILTVENEAELAGMLAHSMAHIAERHGTRMIAQANVSSIPLIFIGGWMAMGPGNDDHVQLPAAFLEIRRRNEMDADRAAVNIMAAAGYDPAALREYIRRTQQLLTSDAGINSTLPRREERISALELAISNTPAEANHAIGGLEAIQDRLKELAASPRSSPRPPSLRRKSGH